MNSTTATQSNQRTNQIAPAICGGAVKLGVVARLTVIRRNEWRTIVEVEAGSTYSSFYKFYRQWGARRSTKQLIRTAGRDEGVSLMGFKHRQQPGLAAIARKLEMYASQSNPVVSKRIRMIKKREYQKLISARPDELGLTQMQQQPIYGPLSVERAS